MTWDLEVGDVARRTDLHVRHGGATSRGISAPRLAPGGRDIMLWWQPDHGGTFGYDDGWAPDGAFYFSGMGQKGDQQFHAPTAENGRVRDHVANGDRIRLLRYVDSNSVRYVCELRLDPSDPWQWRDAPDVLGNVRRVIQFRLLPAGPVDTGGPPTATREAVADSATALPIDEPPPAPSTTLVEALRKPSFHRLVQAQSQAARRLEAILVHDFDRWLTSTGLTTTGLVIPCHPEQRNLRADLFVVEPRALVEAKASTAREHIRMAIGQLLDYARFVTPRPTLCVLTPSRPADDMIDLLASLNIGAVWKDGVRGFDGTPTWLHLRPATE